MMLLLNPHRFGALLPPPSVNNPQGNLAASTSSVTVASYAVGSEADRVMAVVMTWNHLLGSPVTVNSIVFNTSESLTQAVARKDTVSGIEYGTEVWFLLDPSNATADVVATMSAAVTGNLHLHVLYLDGAAQQTPEATASAQDLTSPHEVSITTLTDNAMIVAGTIMRSVNADITALTPSGLTEDTETGPGFGSIKSAMGHEVKPGAGAESGGWTHNGTGGTANAGLAAAAFAPG